MLCECKWERRAEVDVAVVVVVVVVVVFMLINDVKVSDELCDS